MVNPRYVKGRKKEYKIIKSEREKGRVVIRSAGSRSPVDVVSIDVKEKKIYLIQSKSESLSEGEKKRLYKDNKELNGLFLVSFVVV